MIRSNALLCIILIVIFLIGTIKRFKGDYRTNYLFISMFIIAAPFDILWPVLELTHKAVVRGRESLVVLGAFGSVININVGFLSAIILILSGRFKLKKELFYLRNNWWFYSLIGLAVISYFNPYNTFPAAIFPMLFTVTQFWALFILIESNFDRQTIVKGVYYGLAILSILMLVLTIAYPILDLKWVASFFYGKQTYIKSIRREGYPSTVGIFWHPNTLGFFSVIPVSFFACCYLNHYKKNIMNIMFIMMSLFTCFFTFSRVSFLSVFIALITVVVLQQKKTRFVTKKVVVGILCFIACFVLLFWYLSNYQNLLLFKDVDAMLNIREEHWRLGYEIWNQAKILGVGLNTHVYYLAHNDLYYSGATNAFTVNVFIHNIHLIILAELGLIGIVLWIYLLFIKFKKIVDLKTNYSKEDNILKMTFLAILVGLIVAGFFDWSPIAQANFSLVLFFGFFSTQFFSQSINSKDEVRI